MIECITISVAGASLLFNTIGLGIPYWTYWNVKTYQGLWQLCLSESVIEPSYCASFSATTSALQGVRACELLGMLLIMGTIVCFVLKLFVMKDEEMLPKVGVGLAVAAGIVMIIGCVIYYLVVYATNSAPNPSGTSLSHTTGSLYSYNDSAKEIVGTLHAGFVLCIAGGIAAFVASVLGVMLIPE